MSKLGAATERLTGWAQGTVSSAVLMREAARSSRRWQTYAGRLGFSGMLIGGLMLAIWVAVESPFADTAQLAWLGRGLFVGIATLQFVLALMLAPLTCATAIIEETEQGTIDLLVLTKLKSHQIASAKVLSRVLLLLTVVFGAMPVMAAVSTLGGVSGTEVVTVTLHTAMAVLLAGAMGGLFSLFTRSPLLAMLAAAGYAVPCFLVIPAGYAIVSFDPRAATHLSLLGGPAAQGADALLPLLAHLPVLYLTWRIGTKLFSLRTSRSHIREAFSAEVWETKRIGWYFLVLMAISCVVVPIAAIPLWTLRASQSSLWMISVPLQGLLFAWGVAVTAIAAWVYLRVGVDVVDAVDRTFGTAKRGERPPVRVWNNPIAWREARPRAWGASAVPIQFTWLMGVLLLSQSTIWVIPGGLVGLGLFNLIAAVVLTVWLATWSIESERRIGSLEVLLTTTMPSWKVAVGKAAGIALPTLPLVAISLPLLVLGNVYAQMFFEQGGNPLTWMGNGLSAWVWSVCIWAVGLGLGMALALSSNRKSSFAIAMGLLATGLGVPAAAGRLFPDVWWIAGPARLIAPPLAGDPAWWQVAISTAVAGTAAITLFGLTTINLRRWAVASAALLAVGIGLVSTPAHAQVELQSNFYFTARALNDGVSREDQWTAIQVRIENHGGATRGRIEVQERNPGTDTVVPYVREVELPEKSRKDVLLMVRPGIAVRPSAVTLDAGPTRGAEAEIQWQHLDRDGVILGVIGDHPLGVTAIGQTWRGPVPGRRPARWADEVRTVRAGLLDPRMLPRHSTAYAALDQVVWAQADPSDIGARELDALLGWVAAGGHLTVTVTDSWRQVADSPLGEALPVDLVGTRDAADISSLVAALGTAGSTAGPTPQALAVPRTNPDRGVWTVAEDGSGYALWSIGTYGLGTITVMAVDPTTEPLSGHDRIGIWRALMWLPEPDQWPENWRATLDAARPVGSAAQIPSLMAALRVWEAPGYECYWNTGWQDFNSWDMQDTQLGWQSQVRSELNDIPGASPIPLPWLLGFSILYLLAIGPVDYFVLRWLKREPWTWVTFPVTVVLFSGVALIGTAYTKGSQAVVTRVEVVDVLPGTDMWRGQTNLGVFSTRKTRLTLASGSPDGVIGPFGDGGFQTELSIHTQEGPGQIQYRAETYTLAYWQSTWVEGDHGRMRLIEEGGAPILVNNLGVDLEHVVLIEGDPTGRTEHTRILELGPMGSAERVPVGSAARWRTGQPTDDDVRFAWRVLREQPESVGAHLHSGSFRYSVFAIAAEPVEDIALTGLSPIHQNLTVFRAPLGPPVAPGRSSNWSDDP